MLNLIEFKKLLGSPGVENAEPLASKDQNAIVARISARGKYFCALAKLAELHLLTECSDSGQTTWSAWNGLDHLCSAHLTLAPFLCHPSTYMVDCTPAANY
jgi:hypothetical protein